MVFRIFTTAIVPCAGKEQPLWAARALQASEFCLVGKISRFISSIRKQPNITFAKHAGYIPIIKDAVIRTNMGLM